MIKIKNLTKKFEKLVAVDNISFEVKEGEIFGFLGPNGAGKTTTISMLSTLLDPTAGDALVNEFDIKKQRDDVRNSIGVVFQDSTLDDELTAFENMDFHGILYGVPKEKRIKKIDELMKLVGLFDKKDSFVRIFSGGMKRRLEIVRSLVHDPKILFLDEPTIGLDPQTRNHLWEYIKKLNKDEKVTVFLTTHYMDEADKLCDRVAIIDHGKIIALDTPSKLKNTVGGGVIAIKTKQQAELTKKLSGIKWVKKVTTSKGIVNISLANVEEKAAEIIKIIYKEKIEIQSLTVHNPTLEDVFLHFTGKSMREEEASSKDRLRRAVQLRKGVGK